MKNQISITKSKMQINGEITTPKTKYSVRVVDMPPAVMLEVKDYINRLDEVTDPVRCREFSKVMRLRQD